MKKSRFLLIIVGVLLIMVMGVSFAYYLAGIEITGTPAVFNGSTASFIKVEYDAGTNKLEDTLIPGTSVNKDFSVTVTPRVNDKEAKYLIKLVIDSNGFVKCDAALNASNGCKIDEEELVYTLTYGGDTVTGDLTGIASGVVPILTETKNVNSATTFDYNLKIEFVDTGFSQNHNQNKSIKGSVVVEFAPDDEETE